LLNAAAPCFARKPEKFFPNARLRCAVFGTLATPVAIRKKMVSARRNALLAERFQGSLRIEKWGRGIKMILEREPTTEFEEIGTVQLVATFKSKSYEQTQKALHT
jgi:predicted HTH transcriptional regulator